MAQTRQSELARLEQRTLTHSLWGVLAIAVGSVAWGMVIESDVVILNGVFSFVSLMGSALYLTAARLVARPADRRFQYGYAQVEPMAIGINALLLLLICLYAIVNGIEGIRAGGDDVDPDGVIWFGAITGAICAAFGSYELWMARRTGSHLLRNDAREWRLDAGFSLITLIGFAVLHVLHDPARGFWARYADSIMVMVLSLVFLPIPARILYQNVRETLRMNSADEALSARIETAVRRLRGEHDIASHTTHLAKVGRSHFVEINIVVGPAFAAQKVTEQDRLREQVWAAIDLPRESAWVTISFTADPRWARTAPAGGAATRTRAQAAAGATSTAGASGGVSEEIPNTAT